MPSYLITLFITSSRRPIHILHILYILSILLATFFPSVATIKIEHKYHTNKELDKILQDINAKYPRNTERIFFGRAVSGALMHVLMIHGEYPEDVAIPDVKFVANIHGNEAIGRELLLQFANHLLSHYVRGDAEIIKLLDSTRIHMLTSFNPDGFDKAQEGNCTGNKGSSNRNGIDLNNNFPDYFEPEYQPKNQPESQAMMKWLKTSKTHFILSANIRSGDLLVSYPYDNYDREEKVGNQGPFTGYSRSPDDDVYRHIAAVYAQHHPTMYLDHQCDHQRGETRGQSKSGIVNGAFYNTSRGSYKDYSYINYGVLELSLYLHCCKYPVREKLRGIFNDNIKPLIAFLKQANMGIKGRIISKQSGRGINNACVVIINRKHPHRSTEKGEYWRILLPGTYKLTVSAYKYEAKTLTITVYSNTTVVKDIQLNLANPIPKADEYADACTSHASYLDLQFVSWQILFTSVPYILKRCWM